MQICKYARMHVCTYVRMYVCTYVRMYVCTYVRMYVCTYVRMYVCTYVRMYVCTYVRMNIYSYIFMCVCTHARMYEVDASIANASIAFGRLRRNVLVGQGLNLKTNLKVYIAVVMTTLLYVCKTRNVYCRHAWKLNRLHSNCQCRLLRINWQDMIPDTEVYQTCRPAKHACSSDESSTSTGWPCCQNERREVTKAPAVWRTVRGRRSTGGQRNRYHP